MSLRRVHLRRESWLLASEVWQGVDDCSISGVIGLTSDNFAEVGGSSVRLLLNVPAKGGQALRARQGIYAVVVRSREPPQLEGQTATPQPRMSGFFLLVGLAAVPLPSAGKDRCEAFLFDSSDGKQVDEARLNLLFLTEAATNDFRHGAPRVKFVRRLAGFSHLGVGPWLRDLVCGHIDGLNEPSEGAQERPAESAELACWLEESGSEAVFPLAVQESERTASSYWASSGWSLGDAGPASLGG